MIFETFSTITYVLSHKSDIILIVMNEWMNALLSLDWKLIPDVVDRDKPGIRIWNYGV